MKSSPLPYCAEQVKRYDPERFLMALLVPRAKQERLCALFAFNLEVAKIRETASQTMIGLIRLQWWRDAIQYLFNATIDAHPVIEALQQTKLTYWSADLFHRVIDAREMDLEEEAPATAARLWHYCVETTSPLLQLAGDKADDADIAGSCYAMIGLLRAVPFHMAQGKVFLPLDLLAQYGVSPERLREGDKDRVLVPVIRDLCNQVESRLQSFQSKEKSISRLYVLLTQIHLKKLAACGYHVFDGRMIQPDPLLAFKLWWRR